MKREALLSMEMIACLALSGFTLAAQTPVENAWTKLQEGLAENGSDRVIAVRVLGLLEGNPKAAEIAVAALADPKTEIQIAAADALGQMKATSALPRLKQHLKSDTDAGVAIADARALIALGDPSGYGVFYAILTGEKKSGESLLDSQKKMLKDPKQMAQIGFDVGIGFIPFASLGMGAFKTLTKDDITPVRAAATRILAKDSDPRSGEALVKACSDKSWLVRAAALDAVAHRGDPSAIGQIVPQLYDEKTAVRYAAAATIIHLEDIRVQAGGKKK
jgi:HEAT repeat protein